MSDANNDKTPFTKPIKYNTLSGQWVIQTKTNIYDLNMNKLSNFPIIIQFTPNTTKFNESLIVFIQTVTTINNQNMEYTFGHLKNKGKYMKFPKEITGHTGGIHIQDVRPDNIYSHPNIINPTTTTILDITPENKFMTPFYLHRDNRTIYHDSVGRVTSLYDFVSDLKKHYSKHIGNAKNGFTPQIYDAPNPSLGVFQTNFEGLDELYKQYQNNDEYLSLFNYTHIIADLKFRESNTLFETHAFELTPDSKLYFLSKFSWYISFFKTLTKINLQNVSFSVSSELSEETKKLLKLWGNPGFKSRDFVYILNIIDTSLIEKTNNFMNTVKKLGDDFYPDMDGIIK